VVQVNTSVREINLKSNKIGDEGATAIGEALKVPAWLCCIAGAPLPREPPLPRYPRRDSGTQDYTSVYASNNIEKHMIQNNNARARKPLPPPPAKQHRRTGH
jgi:hypothetical protein